MVCWTKLWNAVGEFGVRSGEEVVGLMCEGVVGGDVDAVEALVRW